MNLLSKALCATPYGVRVPTRPDANWSRLVLPQLMPPGRCTENEPGFQVHAMALG